MKRHVRKAVIVTAFVSVAVGLLVGGVSADRLGEEQEQASRPATAAVVAVEDPYPLSADPTSDEIRLVVFERAYSECASNGREVLAAKYKAADTSKRGIAAAVGLAWASYFRAGRDAVRDGRAGCLQGQSDRARAP